MSNNIVSVVARFIAKADKVEEVKQILSDFVEPTRLEKGCIRYDLMQNADDASDFTFYEEWESIEDLFAHSKSEHLIVGKQKLEGLLAEDRDVRRYRQIK